MSDEKELQETYMKYQLLEQQLKQVQQQLKLIEQQTLEMKLTYNALEDIQKVEVGTEMLVPLSSGIFIKAEIKDNQNAILNVGSDVAVNMTLKNAQELIKKQLKEVESAQTQLEGAAHKMMAQMQVVEEELQKLVK